MSKRTEYGAIALMIFALAIVFALASMIRQNMNNLESQAGQVPADLRIGALDSLYINRPLFFSMTAPRPDWSWHVIRRDSSMAQADTAEALWPQIAWLARAAGSDSAGVRVGVLGWPAAPRVRELTITLLAEVLKNVEISGSALTRARVLVPVSEPAHHLMRGAYFAVVTPPPPSVRVITVLPRRDWLYIIEGRCPEPFYSEYRPALSGAVRRFTPLSMTDITAVY